MTAKIGEYKEDCCGCGACASICPKNAIEMLADEEGFLYPNINEDLCISCDLCKKVCRFRSMEKYPNKATYVATIKQEERILKSASGGIFAAAALSTLKLNGVVFGAALTFENGHAYPHHMKIENEEKLWMLQGSKYVQSEIGDTYSQVKEALLSDKMVLFSGTPCQVAGLKSFLGKEYKKLYTIDLICHGVPSAKIFDDYIQKLSQKYGGKIKAYRFRDKTYGWGENTAVEVEGKKTKRIIYRPARIESYTSLFLDGKICRKSCYSCPYASTERIGEISVGDYWGIELAHPELNSDSKFEEKKGVSCILINSQKGQELLLMMTDSLNTKESTIEKASARNEQLKHPLLYSKERDLIFTLYKNKGYVAVDEYFYKYYRKQVILHTIFNKVPRKMRIRLKKLIKRM